MPSHLTTKHQGEFFEMLKLYVKIQSALQALKDERGQDLIEYALLAALISVACISAMTPVATAIKTEFNAVVTAM
jgi:pilus assembly protein Flp/PilA